MLWALPATCPPPTELNEAIEEVIADEGFPNIGEVGSDAIDPHPMVFVDGRRLWVSYLGTGLHPLDPGSVFQLVPRGEILAIHVIKGSEATETYGEEAAHGVINVYTGDAEKRELSITAQEVTGTSHSFGAGTSHSFTGGQASFTDAAGSFTTNPGESILYETARGDWFPSAPEGRTSNVDGQGVLFWASDLLESPNIVRGAILFSKTGDILGRIMVMREDEG